MRKEDKKKLSIHRRIIVNHLQDLEGILDYLISKEVFTPAIRERVIYENKSKLQAEDQIRQFLDSLITKNALAYQYFLEALILTNNNQIANILQPDYESSDACKLMIERERIVLPSPSFSQFFQHSHFQANANNCSSTNSENSNVYPVNASHRLSFPNAYLQHSSTVGMESPANLSSQHQMPCLHPTQNKQLQLSMHYMQYQNSCNSRGSSQSMSPVINRARSSSVNGFYNLQGSRIWNAKSANNSLLAQRGTNQSYNGANDLIDEDCKYPIAVSSNYDDSDQSPACFLNPLDLPVTYNIEWSDVNRLELDFVVYKTLPNITKQLSPDECYYMEKKPRGKCMIINNEHFLDEHGKELTSVRRFGTDMDASRLKNLFEKLHFQVEMHVDQTEREMRHKIVSFANDCDSNAFDYDAICLILLSHGTDGYIYGTDFENRINLDKDILNLFDDVLIGKPKMFIFQACRGENLNKKDSFQNPLSFIPQSCSSSSLTVSSQVIKQTVQSPLTPASSCSSVEDEAIKKFKNLKISSQQAGSLQGAYKKKKPPIPTTSSSSSSSSCSASSSSTSISAKANKKRSRSHSRGKYAAYIASAATAIKTVCKTSPNSSKTILTSISTQTSQSQSTSSSHSLTSSHDEEAGNVNYCASTNIITAMNCTQSLKNFIDGRPIKTCLPSRSDFFIWYSSARGFVSHRDADGSPFIKCLVTVFSRCSYELELIEMVRKVNMLMQQYEKRHFDERNSVASYFMVPVAEYHLAKKLYFNP